MRKLAGLFVAVALSSGCLYYHEFNTSGATAESSPKSYGWSHHFIAGLITLPITVDAQAICPNGVAKVKDYINFVNWLIGVITSEIYTPSSWEVYCVVSAGHAEDATPKTITIKPDAKLIGEMTNRYPNLLSTLERIRAEDGEVASRE